VSDPTSGQAALIRWTLGSDASRVHLHAPTPTVSGVHCEVWSSGRGLWVEDLGSTNGTFVDGVRLTINTPQHVRVGNVVTLGRGYGFRVHASLLQELSLPPGSEPRPFALESMGDPGGMSVAPPVAQLDTREERVILRDASGASEYEPGDTNVTRSAAAEAVSGVDLTRPPEPGAPSISLGYGESNDVVVPIPVVSQRHARIYAEPTRFVIEDQGSTNGTYVNGRRVRLAELTLDQRFRLGAHEMVFDAGLVARLTMPDSPQLAVVTPAASGLKPGDVYVVGRDPSCDIVIVGAPMVSSKHARLTVASDGVRLLIEDLGSTNGTFLNNRDNAVTTPTTVESDDVLYFGSYRVPVSRIPMLLWGVGEDRAPTTPGKRVFTVGRDRDFVDVAIEQPQISRKHATITVLDDGRFAIADAKSSNGVFVDGVRIRAETIVDASARVSLGSVPIELHPERGVVVREYHGDMMIQAQRVSVDVPDAKSPNGRKRILHDVSFTAYPTEFVGLMGPSGAGKTTLMMALNGYTPPSTGGSLVNGSDLYANYNAFRGNIGYVPQDDIVYPQLTVYESLYYTARLRLPPDTSAAEIDTKISAILSRLEIQQTRDVLIGDALKKGISGGQRKRVNLAQELITEPSLLFLDEPTSGLASEDTINVMRLLRELADDGRTILLTIHQPSLEAYRLMDNVIYLFEGRLVYYGPTYPDSVLFFNPGEADGARREQLLADPSNALKPLASDHREAMEAEVGEPRDRALKEAVERRQRMFESSHYYKQYVYDRGSDLFAADVQLEPSTKQQTDRRGWLRQCRVLTERAARIKWKDKVGTAILLVQAPIIACILAAVFSAPPSADPYFDHLTRGPAALFLMVASAVWFGCSNAAREIVGEQAIYRRERMVNLMIPSYVASKFAVLGAVCALQCLMLLAIVYVPLGLSGGFVGMYAILLLTSLVGLGMGLSLSSLVSTPEASIALVPLLLIPQIILGGAIMPVHEMNAPMRVLSATMVARWGFEGLLYQEYGEDDLRAIQDECGIPACVWSVGPSGFAYYPGDPGAEYEAVDTAGLESLAAGVIPMVSPAEESVCQALCSSVRNGMPVTPLDRAFGADRADPVREQARLDIAGIGGQPSSYVQPRPNARTGPLAVFGVLAGSLVFLLMLVMAILKYRDVDVE